MRQLEKILQEISREENFDFQSFANGWILKVNNKFVTGYHFQINNASSSRLCDDKAATSELLEASKIPVVMHTFFMEIDELQMRRLLNRYGRLVIKANQGTGGRDVFQISSQTELIPTVESILSKGEFIAISPFENIQQEYRVIILNGEIQLIYSKQIQEGWKHNLGLGAKPLVIQSNKALEELAKQTALTLNINFASIDIIEVAGELKVLEVNSGVMMEKFSAESDKNYQIAKQIYRKAIL
ncbi:MAG: ATP-grasp domain-containing protein [Streptococcaceae bacterium]|jgi:glutathione synthase/RimK-type ligase-like ATP-grasp enzyme|nr:ATP-grasp domain-containing protein [Streptococcaceae bacterium]